MRQDIEAMMQMRDQFVDSDEAEVWAKENEELSDIIHPFSGHERNRFFANLDGEQFLDLSAVSGLDSPADGRVFVRLDYDRDGWQDIAVVSSSSPMLQLFRNRLGEPESEQGSIQTDPRPSKPRNFVAVRFVGGNSNGKAAEQSNRQGWGTQVTARILEYGHERTLLREHICGEGMAGQNSSTMLIGIGSAERVEELKVAWPSGAEQSAPTIRAGSLITVFENSNDSARKTGYIVERYRTMKSPRIAEKSVGPKSLGTVEAGLQADSEVTVITTMASWCEACAKHQPALAQLPSAFAEGKVSVVGFAIDPEDNADSLQEFIERHSVKYPVVKEPSAAQREQVEALLKGGQADSLPSSLIVDTDGRVLSVSKGLPTISEIRQLLDRLDR